MLPREKSCQIEGKIWIDHRQWLAEIKAWEPAAGGAKDAPALSEQQEQAGSLKRGLDSGDAAQWWRARRNPAAITVGPGLAAEVLLHLSHGLALWRFVDRFAACYFHQQSLPSA